MYHENKTKAWSKTPRAVPGFRKLWFEMHILGLADNINIDSRHFLYHDVQLQSCSAEGAPSNVYSAKHIESLAKLLNRRWFVCWWQCPPIRAEKHEWVPVGTLTPAVSWQARIAKSFVCTTVCSSCGVTFWTSVPTGCDCKYQCQRSNQPASNGMIVVLLGPAVRCCVRFLSPLMAFDISNCTMRCISLWILLYNLLRKLHSQDILCQGTRQPRFMRNRKN